MKAFKIELVVVDFDDLGEKEVQQVIQETRFPNDCISPSILSIRGADIGEWHDGHPLNSLTLRNEAAKKLFSTDAEKQTSEEIE